MFRFVVVLALAVGAAAQAQASETQQPAGQQPASQQPAPGQAAATDDGGFANETEKGSYALGYDFGRMVQTRKVEVVAEQLIAGLRDALTGGRARLSDQEVTVLARGIQNEAMRRMQKERAELAAKNRAEGKAFLEANKERSGVVALPSGLQYEVLRPGDGPKPAADDTVKVNFRGTLLDGTVFDSSDNRTGPVVVRSSSVIPAWTEALAIMSVGAKWKLFVPADLGYGDRVAGNNIPPGATLIFEVELLSIEPRAQSPGSGGDN
jgi:FKBP-type peptidyl-prolyl cis-trans isomerase FklB